MTFVMFVLPFLPTTVQPRAESLVSILDRLIEYLNVVWGS